MDNLMRTRTYTKTAKWYNLICLLLITLGSASLIISAVLYSNETRIFNVEILQSIAVAVAGFIGIVGIFQEKLWAKWFVLFVYGLYIFGAVKGLVSSFSIGAAFSLFIDQNILIALQIVRLITIVVLLVGAVLLLKKPHSEGSAGENE
jgi:hypothetical protein